MKKLQGRAANINRLNYIRNFLEGAETMAKSITLEDNPSTSENQKELLQHIQKALTCTKNELGNYGKLSDKEKEFDL